jgi:hypothetical protein
MVGGASLLSIILYLYGLLRNVSRLVRLLLGSEMMATDRVISKLLNCIVIIKSYGPRDSEVERIIQTVDDFCQKTLV